MKNSHFEHHDQRSSDLIREVVFGMEDGMVSTLGAITGIATGTGDHFTVVLSGMVIIAVESISMGVGSYLSSKSEREVNERKLQEETEEITDMPREEERELRDMYREDGWPEDLARKMALFASQHTKLFLQEMAFRELKIIPDALGNPLQNGITMLLSYIVGGFIPLSPYLFMKEISSAFPLAIAITLGGLFFLGIMTTRYTRRKWWKAGLEMLALASAAAAVGFAIGKFADSWLLSQS